MTNPQNKWKPGDHSKEFVFNLRKYKKNEIEVQNTPGKPPAGPTKILQKIPEVVTGRDKLKTVMRDRKIEKLPVKLSSGLVSNLFGKKLGRAPKEISETLTQSTKVTK